MQTDDRKRKLEGQKSDGEPSPKRIMSEDSKINDNLKDEKAEQLSSSSSDSEMSEGIADDLVAGEKKDAIDNGIQEVKQFTTSIFFDEMDAFIAACDKGKDDEEKFIQDYIRIHEQDNVVTKDDVYSLLLTASITAKNLKLVEYILNIPHAENILTHVDFCRSSPISAAFLSRNEEILDTIAQYIENTDFNMEKPHLSGKDKSVIISTASNPTFKSMEPVDCYRTYLEPIYSEESLKDLADLIGINNYSHD